MNFDNCHSVSCFESPISTSSSQLFYIFTFLTFFTFYWAGFYSCPVDFKVLFKGAPPHPRHSHTKDSHSTGITLLFFRIVRGFFHVPQNYQHSRICETGPSTYRPYPRRLESLTMKLRRQHFLLSYLKTLSVGPVGVSNSRPPASLPGAQPSEPPERGYFVLPIKSHSSWMDGYLVFCFEFSIWKHSVKRKTCNICTAALQNMEWQNYSFHAWTLCFDRRHLGEATLRATALDLRSEDHECKTYKPLVKNHCCYPSNRRFIDTLSILL